MSADSILVQAHVAASPSICWDCYTGPGHIVHWNFASPDWCCPSAENDVAVGGRYKARMEAKDGSMGFDFEGIYTSVDLGKGLTYRLEDGRSVSVRFSPDQGGTLVEVQFDPEAQNPQDLQRVGWQAILNNFKRYAEREAL